MSEQTKTFPQNAEDGLQNDQENCVDNIRVDNTFSTEATDQKLSAGGLKKPQSSFLKGDMMATSPGESISPVADTNSDGDVAPEQSDDPIGPPSNIIQQSDEASEQLVNLDSIQDSEQESDVSDLNGAVTKGDDNKTSLLNMDSSSTSQGSQGSYAHQVPASSGSHDSNGIGVDQQPYQNVLTHHLSVSKDSMSDQRHSPRSRLSNFLNLEEPQNTLDDILGPKGEPLETDLDPDGEPVQSDLDDILGPQSDGKPSDLDETLGPYEGSTIGIPQSGQTSGQGNNVAREGASVAEVAQSAYISQVKTKGAASISLKQKPLIHSQQVSSIHQLYHQLGAKDSLESKSTLESKGTAYSETSKSSILFTSESSYRENTDQGYDETTLGDTTDQGYDETTLGDTTMGDTTLADTTLSPQNQSSLWDSSNGGTFSPNSYLRKTGYTLSSETSVGAGFTFSNSRRDTFSPREDSMLSLDSSGTLGLSQGDSRNQTIQSNTEESSKLSRNKYSQFSDPEYTDDTQHTFDTLANGTDSIFGVNEFSNAEASQSSPTKHTQFSDTEHTTGTAVSSKIQRNQCSNGEASQRSRTKRTEHTTGTRVFSTTSTNAIYSIDGSNNERPPSPRRKKFTESILDRTRSRADPDALLNNSSSIEAIEKPTRSMINVNAQEEGGFIESTAIARKRGRVVQLLTIGLLSFLISFLGGFLVMSSCHFVSVAVQQNGEEYDLHLGLWKYSPAESASQGYTYCSNYDVVYPPRLERLSSLLALFGGGFSLCVLWIYLVLGRSVKNLWNVAVYAAAISGILQLSTLSFLSGSICTDQICTLGPAGTISIVAGFFYFLLAFEMYYNAPIVNYGDNLAHVSSREDPRRVVTNLEMTDFEYGAKAYVQRISFGESNSYHTQTRLGGTTKDNENAPYVPPSAIV